MAADLVAVAAAPYREQEGPLDSRNFPLAAAVALAGSADWRCCRPIADPYCDAPRGAPPSCRAKLCAHGDGSAVSPRKCRTSKTAASKPMAGPSKPKAGAPSAQGKPPDGLRLADWPVAPTPARRTRAQQLSLHRLRDASWSDPLCESGIRERWILLLSAWPRSRWRLPCCGHPAAGRGRHARAGRGRGV